MVRKIRDANFGVSIGMRWQQQRVLNAESASVGTCGTPTSMPRMPEEYRESRKGGNGQFLNINCVISFDPQSSVAMSHFPEEGNRLWDDKHFVQGHSWDSNSDLSDIKMCALSTAVYLRKLLVQPEHC